MTRRKVLGSKNTVIMAVPKSLKRYIVSVQLELQQKENNKRGKKKKTITLLEAGLEINKRLRK